ncbi:MAG: 4Fe-4S binding protein [Eubacteriales bacterium]|nr:4Fe-4S binding protein [Eubacteriales bacterium]
MQNRLKQHEKKRTIFQGLYFLVTNAHLSGFVTGEIYQGPTKHVCVPGLNCYSCPGAMGACPMGSLQASLYDTRQLFPFYVLGLLMTFGLIFGRLICGFLCPFGFLQDLLAKLPVKKYRLEQKKPRLDRVLRNVKYLILIFFVLVLPLLGRFYPSLMSPWFCKYICPSGTIFAGWPMLTLNETLRPLMGFIFSWKTTLAIAIVALAIFIPRFFCRYMCPLGALYGLFNKVSLYQLKFQEEACIHCGACKRACPMGVDMPNQYKSPECVRCGRCVASCPTSCLSSGFGSKAKEPLTKSGKASEA